MEACTPNTEEPQQVKVIPATQLPSKHKNLEVDRALLISLKDPVCGMSVKKNLIDTLTYEHNLYGFCGTGCKDAFLKDPIQHNPVGDSEIKK
ncbi:MAG: YHS domain-containing protein [Bacteroidia bacterium]|nr:YHS domain-containing protein [Bacteroidia bacterium]